MPLYSITSAGKNLTAVDGKLQPAVGEIRPISVNEELKIVRKAMINRDVK